jgi:hypothetical protein
LGEVANLDDSFFADAPVLEISLIAVGAALLIVGNDVIN